MRAPLWRRERRLSLSGRFTFKSKMIMANMVVIIFAVCLSTAVCLRIGRDRAVENTVLLSRALIQQQLKNAGHVRSRMEENILTGYTINQIPEQLLSMNAARGRMMLETRMNQMAYQWQVFDFTLARGLFDDAVYRSVKNARMLTPAIEASLADGGGLLETLEALGGRCHWSMIDGQLVVGRMLYRSSMLKPAGYLLVGVNQELLQEQMGFDSPESISYTALALSDGTVISSSPVLTPSQWRRLADETAGRGNDYQGGWHNLDGENYYVQSEGLPKSDWVTINVIHERYFLSEWDRVFFSGAAVAVAAIAVALVFTVLTALSMTKRVRRLINRADEIADGHFYSEEPMAMRDEFGLLANRLDTLGEQIDHSVRRALEEANAKREMEYKMLELQYNAIQAQINPHFIYNSLETINSVALMQNEPEISQLICRFAQLFRFSVQKINREISLGEELEYIKKYLSFYHLAYPNRIAVSIDCPPRFEAISLPSAILQPLVENVIVHAVEKSLSIVHVEVRCYEEGGLFHTEVRDDGRGMEAAEVERLTLSLRETRDRPREGGRLQIGLYSVNRLIQLRYGKSYGLRIQSDPGVGTSVGIVFPADPAQYSKKTQ